MKRVSSNEVLHFTSRRLYLNDLRRLYTLTSAETDTPQEDEESRYRKYEFEIAGYELEGKHELDKLSSEFSKNSITDEITIRNPKIDLRVSIDPDKMRISFGENPIAYKVAHQIEREFCKRRLFLKDPYDVTFIESGLGALAWTIAGGFSILSAKIHSQLGALLAISLLFYLTLRGTIFSKVFSQKIYLINKRQFTDYIEEHKYSILTTILISALFFFLGRIT